jgi:hypothetical protein
MKKGSKKQPKTESATLADRLKSEKATVIALVIATILFFGALFGIYSGNILHGAGDIFSSDPDERIEFERATVVEIVSDPDANEEETTEAEEVTSEDTASLEITTADAEPEINSADEENPHVAQTLEEDI